MFIKKNRLFILLPFVLFFDLDTHDGRIKIFFYYIFLFFLGWGRRGVFFSNFSFPLYFFTFLQNTHIMGQFKGQESLAMGHFSFLNFYFLFFSFIPKLTQKCVTFSSKSLTIGHASILFLLLFFSSF